MGKGGFRQKEDDGVWDRMYREEVLAWSVDCQVVLGTGVMVMSLPSQEDRSRARQEGQGQGQVLQSCVSPRRAS